MIGALAMHISTLYHPEASVADKVEALKFLGHFVGDIHQPLHVGRAEDKGGNTIRVSFIGKETNLHAVWSGGLIASLGLNWQALADRLHASILDAERITWQRSDVHDWAEESHRLAVMRVYMEPAGGDPDRGLCRVERARGRRATQEGGRAARLDPAGRPWPAA